MPPSGWQPEMIDSGLRHVKVTVIQKEVEIEVVSNNLEPPGGGLEHPR